MINIGIDLGTTNSAIAKFDQGAVKVFQHPINHSVTLPSVVGYQEGRLLVGEKAREYLLASPDEVAASFKRKMGTGSKYVLNQSELTPVDLSALVLKELKTFLPTGEQPQAAVITIPASFDTIQSNATKAAGYAAGFSQVELLQEPIAASLAYANAQDTGEPLEGKWLVYDLGGGTFDVALVSILDGEMRVLDHEGDNFLGGTDFDRALVENILVPYIESQGAFDQLLDNMRSASGRYNQLYQILMLKAEQAKIELSTEPSAEIEFETKDDKGELVQGFLTITRAQFESILTPFVNRTLDLIGQVLERNKLSNRDLSSIVLVGGATYTPHIRTSLSHSLRIPVFTQIDPTTAVVVGAAYYAGTRRRAIQATIGQEPLISTPQTSFDLKTAYQKASQEEKEYFAARIDGPTQGHTYRIVRKDGGFDSGIKPLTAKISEFLPLLPNTYNLFELTIYDPLNNPIPIDIPPIGITQGKFTVVGQPLPQDICLEIDDIENQTTVLEVVFEKNSILPLKKTLVKQVTSTISKGSEDTLNISVVEGPNTALPAANQTIGFITISGKDLARDLVRGSDVEVSLTLSESRDLSITAYLLMTDQEFENVFVPSERQVNVSRLADELHSLAEKVRHEIAEAETEDQYESAQQLVDLEYEILGLVDQVKGLAEDDSSDRRFQMEDQKRRFAQKVDELIRDKLIIKVKNAYFEAKRDLEIVMEIYEVSPEDASALDQLLEQEKITLATNSSLKIKEYTNQLRRLGLNIRWRSDQYVRELFLSLANGPFYEFTDNTKASGVIREGYTAIEQQNFDRLRTLVNRLLELLPPSKRPKLGPGGTGIK